ncbi:MAG: hypothetical protein ACK2UW_16830 [Anaerolineales bacterium]
MDTATQKPSNLGVWWVLATALGYIWSTLAYYYIGLKSAPSQFWWNDALSLYMSYAVRGEEYIFSGLLGLTIGLAQGLILRRKFSLSNWVLASAAGWGLGTLLGILVQKRFSNYETMALAIGIASLFIGFFQSLILRKKYIRAYWWIILNVIGWCLAIAPVVWMIEKVQVFSERFGFLLLGFWWFPGLILGIITAIGLLWIMRGPVTDEMETEAAVDTK